MPAARLRPASRDLPPTGLTLGLSHTHQGLATGVGPRRGGIIPPRHAAPAQICPGCRSHILAAGETLAPRFADPLGGVLHGLLAHDVAFDLPGLLLQFSPCLIHLT